MKLALTPEADSINVQALNMGRIVVDVDGVTLAELINVVCDNGYSLRVVDESDRTSTDARHHLRCPYRHTLQYRAYHGKGQRLAVLAVASDE